MKRQFFATGLKKLAIVCCLAATSLLTTGLTHANLLITPTRVVLADGDRSQEVTLLNNSRETKTYRIELENKIQDETGQYISISADAAYPGNSAMEYIRYSPRIVTIEPGKYQKIKLRVRLPSSLPNGEYRVHLAMRSIDSPGAGHNSDSDSGMQVKIVPKMSFSIPVILRHGDNNMQTNISGVQLLPGLSASDKPSLDVILKRTGAASSYGTITAYMKTPNNSQVQQIGMLHNVAVYTERDSRHVKIPLWIDSIPQNAVVQVVYEGDEEYEGQNLGVAAFKYSN
ncbi:hypothetical protein [Halioxenophilus sp. WMMB6]|uniref:fimbrial biogenesis chaperone n=1 Tax=Halioxenophilus sp. WMMB6 TaxID=3073815 RepID=UPI00295E81A4|nr:hypothetical protein [Halioxenophilus sp. WMMB6]